MVYRDVVYGVYSMLLYTPICYTQILHTYTHTNTHTNTHKYTQKNITQGFDCQLQPHLLLCCPPVHCVCSDNTTVCIADNVYTSQRVPVLPVIYLMNIPRLAYAHIPCTHAHTSHTHVHTSTLHPYGPCAHTSLVHTHPLLTHIPCTPPPCTHIPYTHTHLIQPLPPRSSASIYIPLSICAMVNSTLWVLYGSVCY